MFEYCKNKREFVYLQEYYSAEKFIAVRLNLCSKYISKPDCDCDFLIDIEASPVVRAFDESLNNIILGCNFDKEHFFDGLIINIVMQASYFDTDNKEAFIEFLIVM